MGPAAWEGLREAHPPDTAHPGPPARSSALLDPGAPELSWLGRVAGCAGRGRAWGLSRERGKPGPRQRGLEQRPSPLLPQPRPEPQGGPVAPDGSQQPRLHPLLFRPPASPLDPFCQSALPFPDCRPRLPSWQPFPGAPAASDLLLHTDCASLRRLRHAAQDEAAGSGLPSALPATLYRPSRPCPRARAPSPAACVRVRADPPPSPERGAPLPRPVCA